MKGLPIENVFVLANAKKSRGVGVTTQLAEICKKRPDHTYLVVRDLAEAKRVNNEHGIRCVAIDQILKGNARGDAFTSYVFDPDALLQLLALTHQGYVELMIRKDKEIQELKEKL